MSINILNYKPSAVRLNYFRHWHVEPLLNQAASILDRCLEDLKEFNSLRISAEQLKFELELYDGELKLDKKRQDYSQRELKTSEIKKRSHEKVQGDITNAYRYSVMLEGASSATSGVNSQPHLAAQKTLSDATVILKEIEFTNQLDVNQVNWATSDKDIIERRISLRERILNEKTAKTKRAEVFDFNFRANLVYGRLQRDYFDSIDRIFVASRGMKIIYGYEIDFELEYKAANKEVDEGVINDAVRWVRNAIEWLVAYGQMDQSFTTVISLTSLLNDDDRNRLRTAIDEIEIKFRIPNYYFDTHDNVRCRGFGASLIGIVGIIPFTGVGIIPWTIELRPPEKVYYLRKGVKYPTQQILPKCIMGRVQSATNFRNIEICGIISLMNASPCAQEGDINDGLTAWTVIIKRPRNTSERFGEIQDILIELNLVGKLEVNEKN